MSLDEPANHKHAAMVESPDHPSWDEIHNAREQVFLSLRGIIDRDELLSEKAQRQIVNRLISHAASVTERLAEVREKERPRLQQQRTSKFSDEDAVLERLHHLKSEETYLNACLRTMGSVYAPKLADVDERGADEDDRRVSDEVAAEKASASAPRIAS